MLRDLRVESRGAGARGLAPGRRDSVWCGMDERMNSHEARGAQPEHVAAFNSASAYRSSFEDLILTYLDVAPRRDRTGARDGRRQAMRRALDNRASYYQIRDWRQGYRPAPAWACDLLQTKIARRHAAESRHLKNKTAGD